MGSWWSVFSRPQMWGADAMRLSLALAALDPSAALKTQP